MTMLTFMDEVVIAKSSTYCADQPVVDGWRTACGVTVLEARAWRLSKTGVPNTKIRVEFQNFVNLIKCT